jgi:hypothetical protein
VSWRGRFLLAIVLVSGCVPGARADACGDDSAQYNGYLVQRVEIETPIWFFAAATFGFDQLKARLPIQENQPFSAEKLSRGNALIRDDVRSAGAEAEEKVKFIVVAGRAVNCDAANRTLGVVYRVFTNVYRPYLSHTFEQRTQEVQRPATTGAEGGTEGRFLIKPFGGYDHALHGFAGLDMSSRARLGIFQNLELHSCFSSNSMTEDVEPTGSSDPHRKALEHTEWRAGFHYFDVPAGGAKLKEGKLAAQFVGSTKELSNQGTVLRFGGSLEAGHQQTAGVAMPTALANSSFGSVKLFAGTTARSGRQVFTTSYGVQLGSTLTGRALDFIKHVVDFGYGVRFLRTPHPGERTPAGAGAHKPFDLEIHGSAGIIPNIAQNQGQVPLAERFYGGNKVQNFISGNSWVMPEGALIRSIPENQLGGLAPNRVAGGTRFYSGSLTVAKALWGRPLLPKELAEDREFQPTLDGAIATAKGELLDFYESKDPAFEAADSDLEALAHAAQELARKVDGLPANATSIPAIAGGVQSIKSGLRRISRTLDSIRKADKTLTTSLVNRQLPSLETELGNLVEHLITSGQGGATADLTDLQQSIERSRQKLMENLAKVNVRAAQAKADQDFAPAQRVLDAFRYELNTYTIAPVAIFDVARVWPASTSTRYAVGGGVRLSLVNVNFTLGYAASPKRKGGEGAGALFVGLDVTDLFH